MTLDRECERCREAVLAFSMNVSRAKMAEARLDTTMPFYAKIEFIEAIAALVVIYKEEAMRKVTGANKPVYRVLWCATESSRIEWYLNNTRLRHMLERRKLSLLPSGTSSNEALHAEINAWFRQTQQMYQDTLRLKLACLSIGKLLAHNAALYSPTTRQMSANMVLTRVCTRPLWTDAEWQAWCDPLYHASVVQKAHIPLTGNKIAQKAIVRNWVCKRPVTVAKAKPRKRTPFTLERVGSFITGGVKRSIFKKPSASKK